MNKERDNIVGSLEDLCALTDVFLLILSTEKNIYEYKKSNIQRSLHHSTNSKINNQSIKVFSFTFFFCKLQIDVVIHEFILHVFGYM